MKIAFPGIIALVFTAMLPGALSAAPIGPEDVEWRLLMLGDMPAPTLPGGRQVHLLLDSAQKKAAGFAGCNRFFGTYELDGPALGFGPLAATRMACPDAESALEAGFLDALARTRDWKITAGELLLVDDATVLARLAAGQGGPSDAVLESLTLHSKVLTSGPVRLAHGEYRAAAAPGSASEVTVRLTDMRAFGILNDTQAGAVIINTSTGGTGTFRELALLTRTAEGWTNPDTLLLGDRVQVHSVAITEDEIGVSMKTHAPRDPRCCPTQEVQQRFVVRDNRLVPVPETAATSQPRLVGQVWRWLETRYGNDERALPAKPENYTVQFLEDGRLDVRADCNRKGGTYTKDGRRLSITIITSTNAACEPGSLEEPFVRELASGIIYFFQDGYLYIDLPYDTGTMKFYAQKPE